MGSKAAGSNQGQKRARRSEAQWRALMGRFERSGISRSAFCARHGVPVSTFDWWRKRLKGVSLAGGSRKGSEALFVELTAAAAEEMPRAAQSAEAWDVELELGAGVVLRVRRSAAAC